jgi:hypothetical protein
MFNLIISNNFIKKKTIKLFNKKKLFFFKFLKLKNTKKKNQISVKKIINTKLIKFFITRLRFKRKRYKKYNYFKFSIIKYMRYINNINIYKLNNFLVNYKFNLYFNEIIHTTDNIYSNPIFSYITLHNKIKPTKIKKIKKLKKYKFKKRR